MYRRKMTKKEWIFSIGLIACTMAVVLSATLYFVSEKNATVTVSGGETVVDPPVIDEPDVPEEPETKEILFTMPVKGEITGAFSSVPVFSETMGRYSAHLALDIFAEEGSEVFAAYDGTVVDVSNSVTKGVSVTVDHGNGLTSVYNSLESDDDVKVGDVVKAGDVIGYVSTSNRQEAGEGPHVHFAVFENGVAVDPEKYLVPSVK